MVAILQLAGVVICRISNRRQQREQRDKSQILRSLCCLLFKSTCRERGGGQALMPPSTVRFAPLISRTGGNRGNRGIRAKFSVLSVASCSNPHVENVGAVRR